MRGANPMIDMVGNFWVSQPNHTTLNKRGAADLRLRRQKCTSAEALTPSPSMPSPLASAFLPLLVLFPIYIVLNITPLGDYSWSWLLLSLACGRSLWQMYMWMEVTVGTWFTYAVMQIFFGGFSGLENRVGGVDIDKAAQDTVI